MNNFSAKFINQTIAFLEEWQFDGLDLVRCVLI
jgi:chitinase